MNRLFQYLSYPVIWFFSTLFLKVEFRNPQGLDIVKGKSAVIIANHVSYFDSFLLRLTSHSVGLSLYFMGVKRFRSRFLRLLWSIGIIPVVYYFLGVFLVHPGAGLVKNLETARQILSNNNQIFIFPEGSVNRTGNLRSFKLGAATLATSEDTVVLLIAYNVVNKNEKTNEKKKIIITVGEVMKFEKGIDPLIANKELEDRLRTMLANV